MLRFVAVLAIVFSSAAAQALDGCEPTRPPAPAFIPPSPYVAEPLGANAFLLGTSNLWVAVANAPWHGLRHKLFWWRPGFNGAQEGRPTSR